VNNFRKMPPTTMIPITLEDPDTKYSVKLVEKLILSHDSRIFRFALPSKEHILGLPTGQHIHVFGEINDRSIARKYTPVTSDDDRGFMDLLVKVYFRNVHPTYPDGGKITQYLDNLKLGDTIDIRGPSGRCVYKGYGEFSLRAKKKKDKHGRNEEKKKRRWSEIGTSDEENS